LQVLTFSQGAATLLNAFGDVEYIQREVSRLTAWLAEQFPDGNEAVSGTS
jgi:hypothetical protein